MTKLEWAKIRNARKVNSRALLEAAKIIMTYPPDLHIFWDHMIEEKDFNPHWAADMIYNLGYLDGQRDLHASMGRGQLFGPGSGPYYDGLAKAAENLKVR